MEDFSVKNKNPTPVGKHLASGKNEAEVAGDRRTGEQDKHRVYTKIAPFFAVLILVTVLAWLIPLRPITSAKEKRDLEAFPEFSAEALFSADYFRGIDLWFSDTFTGRELWIGLSQRLQDLYGYSDIVIYGDLDTVDTVPVKEESAQPPMPSPVPVEADDVEETEAPPAEEEFVPSYEMDMEALQDEIIDIGSVIQIGDSVYAFITFNRSYAEDYASYLNRAAELCPDTRIFNVPSPRSTTILLPREFRESIGCVCEEDIVGFISPQVTEDIIQVDTIDALLRHNDEYIFFHGDHHWTALGAYYAYEAWAKAAGFEPVPLSEYEEDFQAPFRGTYYYRANQSGLIAEDVVYTYKPPGDVHLRLCDGNATGYEIELLPKIRPDSSDKYVTFLLGDHPMNIFTNNDITDGSVCMMLKDSNGNPFSYYLTQHYQTVYVLDYRFYSGMGLKDFVEKNEVDDVIFCLSIDASQGQSGTGFVNRFVR